MSEKNGGGVIVAGGADSAVEQIIVHGDLAKLNPADRTRYYLRVCESLGLNPVTRPFDYVTLQGKMQLYARRDCAEQLRKLHKISLHVLSRERLDGDVYAVRVKASMPDGRCDESEGVVSVAGLKGEALANALMKTETKAKRRVTLSICGLGFIDETELETVADAVPLAREAAESPAAKVKQVETAAPGGAKPLGVRLAEWDADLVARGVAAKGELLGHVREALKLAPDAPFPEARAKEAAKAAGSFDAQAFAGAIDSECVRTGTDDAAARALAGVGDGPLHKAGRDRLAALLARLRELPDAEDEAA